VKSVPELTHHENQEKSAPTNSEVHSETDKIPGSLSNNTVIGYPCRPKILLAPTPDEVILLIKD
jgi:hypothetical protein